MEFVLNSVEIHADNLNTEQSLDKTKYPINGDLFTTLWFNFFTGFFRKNKQKFNGSILKPSFDTAHLPRNKISVILYPENFLFFFFAMHINRSSL